MLFSLCLRVRSSLSPDKGPWRMLWDWNAWVWNGSGDVGSMPVSQWVPAAYDDLPIKLCVYAPCTLARGDVNYLTLSTCPIQILSPLGRFITTGKDSLENHLQLSAALSTCPCLCIRILWKRKWCFIYNVVCVHLCVCVSTRACTRVWVSCLWRPAESIGSSGGGATEGVSCCVSDGNQTEVLSKSSECS